MTVATMMWNHLMLAMSPKVVPASDLLPLHPKTSHKVFLLL
jgi:hypothetical protein